MCICMNMTIFKNSHRKSTRNSAVGSVCNLTISRYSYWPTVWAGRGLNPGRGRRFSRVKTLRLALRPIQVPIEWIRAYCRGVLLTTYLHLAPGLRMIGAIHLRSIYIFFALRGITLPSMFMWLLSKTGKYISILTSDCHLQNALLQ